MYYIGGRPACMGGARGYPYAAAPTLQAHCAHHGHICLGGRRRRSATSGRRRRVRVGVELMLGWACADNACTSVWACTPSGLVREDTRCLAIALCSVDGFRRSATSDRWAGSESGCRVDARMGLRGQCLHLGVGVHSKRACS